MAIIDGVNLGHLTDYLFVFTDGSIDANWQGATKGYVGDVGVDGLIASERTSGAVPYAGTIYTNDVTLGAWESIITQPVNAGQAFGSTGQVARIAGLEADLASAFAQIGSLPVTPGFDGVAAAALNGLNTQDGIDRTYVINITSGFTISSQIRITGDAGDVFILRWDEDLVTPGYQGTVKFQSGGAIVPLGGLLPSNFINVAGDINSSGGGSTPLPPYPQGPRFNNGLGALINGGSDFSGGGFFTGYWLTTGDPTTGQTEPLSNGIFVGGWYTSTTKFSMTSGTSGVYVAPNPATIPSPDIQLIKSVSVDGGVTFEDADTPPGPTLTAPTNPIFRFHITNTGNVTLSNVTLVDSVLGPVSIPTTTLAPGQFEDVDVTGTFMPGQHTNVGIVTGQYSTTTVSDSNPANYFGVAGPAIMIKKYVSVDGGVTYEDAETPPGPYLVAPTAPMFKYVVTNIGTVTLTDITVTDNVYGTISPAPFSLVPGASVTLYHTGVFALGQHTNTATATGYYNGAPVTDTDDANFFGTAAAAIMIKKYVSVDGGTTYDDADTPPGPTLVSPQVPMFKYVVTNTGNVTLTNVTVTDSVYGVISSVPVTLVAGGTTTFYFTGTFAAGPHTNTGTATGFYEETQVTSPDDANFFGAESAGISVVKYVSVDNGMTWYDANSPPGPELVPPTNPQFQFKVTNTGQATLTGITLVDTVLGPIMIPTTTLAPGSFFLVTVTGQFMSGQQTNTATVTGHYDTSTVTDSDDANYFGLLTFYCEVSFCVVLDSTAPVRLLLPTYGVCTPAACPTLPLPPCPVSGLPSSCDKGAR